MFTVLLVPSLTFLAPAPDPKPNLSLRPASSIRQEEAELAPFPDLQTASQAVRFLSARDTYLEGMRQLYLDPYYLRWIDAAQRDNHARLEAWRALFYARSFSYHRPWLDDLHQSLGDDAYRAGVMPLVADVRFFQSID